LNEGGYNNTPGDRGGRTYKGISEKNFPAWEGWKIIDKYEPIKDNYLIKDEQLDNMVYRFYRDNFWSSLRLQEINSQPLAEEIYDTAVNTGSSTAVKFLQMALNLLNKNQKDYKNILEDGVMGWITTSLANQCPYQAALLKTLNGLQFMRYVEICRRDESQEKFFMSWLNRT
jgi:lysozyme family protein